MFAIDDAKLPPPKPAVAAISSIAQNGVAVLVISSELPEIMGICDRILVMNHGEIQAEFPRGNFDGGRILEAAMKRRGPAEPVRLEGAA